MGRRAAKVDANQAEVVDALRRIGASVQTLHAVGMGCPDILVGFRSINLLMEIKDGDKPASATNLTSWQEDWHLKWEGQAAVVYSADEAIELLFEATCPVPFKGTIS